MLMGADHTAPFSFMKKFLNITHKSLTELGSPDYQLLWLRAKAEGYEGLSICLPSVFTKAEDGDQKSKFHAVFSSANEDRHGDIVHQDFDLKAFKKNPVFLDSHNYGSIERIIGKVGRLTTKDGKLEGDIEFFLDNPLGTLAAKAAEQGFLNTTSIGFIPREFNDKGEILKSELLEISAVSVPANADALFEKQIGPETPEDEPEPDDQPTEEPDDEEESIEPDPEEQEPELDPNPEPEPKSINRKAVAARVVSEMAAERQKHLKALAKAVHELTEENKNEKRRKIYQTIRKLLSEDG